MKTISKNYYKLVFWCLEWSLDRIPQGSILVALMFNLLLNYIFLIISNSRCFDFLYFIGKKLNVVKIKFTSATKQQLLKMCYLRHSLRISLFHRKVMFYSQYIQVFLFLAISSFIKSVTSRRVLVYETKSIFEYIFWTTTH